MKKIILINTLVFFLTGCAGIGKYAVNVDSIAAYDAFDHTTYAIIPGAGVSDGLEFDSYANQLESVLAGLGFIRKQDTKDASVDVLLSYRVGKAQVSNYTTSVPEWGITGYRGSYTRGTMVGNQYTGITTYVPAYGIAGYRQVSNTVTDYPLSIQILAKSSDTSKEKTRELWQTTITAMSSKPDLRRAFPIMLYAAAPYVGGDTGGIKTIMVPSSLFPEAQ